MLAYQEIAESTYYFTSTFPFMGEALLPVNRFAIKGSKKSMVIDTGAPAQSRQSLQELSEVINPAELDYIFISHMDAEHYGGMFDLLAAAPKARIVCNMTSFGKGTSLYGIAPERFAVVFPGQEIDLGDRVVRVEPSLIEDGHTDWLFDTRTHTYFTSDAFGSIQFGPAALYAETVPSEAFFGGFTLWQGANFNMLPRVDLKKFEAALRHMQAQDVQQIASVHGPVIRQDVGQVFEMMLSMPTAEMPAPPPLPPFLHL
ncbi:MAG TPA: MBL fold metallo-hydrolase [Chloroflexia bacterium]|nr:MBL fold metallo-hydrolase [Chloroflexia bacterium]